MPTPETQRVKEIRQKLNKVYLRLAYGKSDIETAKKEVDEILTQDRQHILAVLKEGVEEMKLTYVFSGVNWKDTDMESNQVIYGYNQAIKDVEALLQETLGEGKEINSIFKE